MTHSVWCSNAGQEVRIIKGILTHQSEENPNCLFEGMSIVVGGGGLAGMATSLAIGTFVQGAQVKLFERLSEKEWLDVAEDKSIGIWSMGLGALRDVDVHRHVKWKFVSNSSYRSASGAVLARPNMRLDSEHVLSTLVKSSKPKRPALAFADEREVRTTMLERIRQCSNVEVTFGAGCAITGVAITGAAITARGVGRKRFAMNARG